jgi:predicted translin family RNA/ssDNA-binding protein
MKSSEVVFRALRDRVVALSEYRIRLQRTSSDMERASKQAIFALQRDDVARAEALLREAKGHEATAEKLIAKEPMLGREGMWHAAREEYAEARFCERAVRGDAIVTKEDLKEDPDIVLGALSDLIGENVRRAIAAATRGDAKTVDRIYEQSVVIVDFLTSLDLTGGLRSKGDQARGHLRRLEDIRYDLSRRGV